MVQHLVKLCQQCGQTVAGFRARQQDVRVKGHGVGGVALVVDDQLGDVRAFEAAQHFIGHGQLFGGLCVARVGHLDDDIRERGFLQRGLERLHQMVRQAADKADGIHQNNLQAAGQHQLAGRRVQRRKQHVGFKNLLAAQRVQQARLADVRVADQRDHRHIVLLAGPAGLAAALFQLL